MTVRRRLHRPVIAGLVAALAWSLSGCGSQLIPGVAASVNGVHITQNQVDDLVLAACDYSALIRRQRQQAQPGTSVASLKATITEALIQFQITGAAARQLGVTVSDARVAQVASSSPVSPKLSASDRTLLSGFFKSAALSQLQLAVIGAHQGDSSITTATHVTSSDIAKATATMTTFAAKQDVVVNPAYGAWNGTRLVTTSGSLSHAVSPAAVAAASGATPTRDLPASQVCG